AAAGSIVVPSTCSIGPASAGSVRTARARSIVATCACTGMVVVACRRRSLLIIFAPRLLLIVFCSLPVRLRLIYRVPASVVVLLPAVTGVLVNVAIVAGIHIAAGGFAGRSVPPLHARSSYFSSLRTLGACYRSISGGVMA